MNDLNQTDQVWPTLDYLAWKETALTLKLYTQIVGKIRLSQSPWVNHGWQVPLYVTSRGLGTSPIPIGNELFEIEFNFIGQRLTCHTSNGRAGSIALESKTVAAFYFDVLALLKSLGVSVRINTIPNEVEDPISFPLDVTHSTYDPVAAHCFWRALIQADRMLKLFRTSFVGKVSPVHFFWGSFDLAVTRFSGRQAPLHPGAPGLPHSVVQDAYSHEVSSAGFWPGNNAFPHAVFYSYAYPARPGFGDAPMPLGARFEPSLGEYILLYDQVRASNDPDGLILEFLIRTYAAAADLGGWDRNALDCVAGRPGVPKVA